MTRRSDCRIYHCSRCPGILFVPRRIAIGRVGKHLADRGWRRAEPEPGRVFGAWVCGECWEKENGQR